jgi:two-component system, chemotaxis family, protein-glutamate methylesterase/glutaminase
MEPRMPDKVKVLIVDDSAFVRQTLKEILESDPAIEVIAVAADPYAAVERIKAQLPDVITLDIEMPRMDGLTFLERLMGQHPIPVVICSTLTAGGSDVALAALAKGAVEVITKPKLGTKEFFEESRVKICDIVKAAAHARLARCRPSSSVKVEPKLTADAVLAKPASAAMIQTTEKVVVVGASTGGTEALREFLEAMPLDAPGIVVVQHMPEEFTARFAQRLDGLCRISVKEAADNDSVIRGQALIAPGTGMCCSNVVAPGTTSKSGRPAGQQAPTVGRRALPLRRALCRKECGRCHHDRYGRRRRAGDVGDEAGRGRQHRPGRGVLAWCSGCRTKRSSSAAWTR